MKYRLPCLVLSLGCILSMGIPLAADEPRFEFNRLIAHWDAYGDDKDYLAFVSECRPQVAQVGFYGAHFWSLSHTDQYAGYPSHFPVQGLDECGEWFERFNGEIHQREAKVVGHFNIKFLIGDIEGPDGPRGFFKFYRDLWDEDELGPRPVADPRDFLERDADGKFRRDANYAIGGMGEYWACLNNPHWKAILKAWTKRGIERGVDGYMINYFYRGNCLCEHCQQSFRDYLAERFSPDELNQKFGIADLENHVFDEIVSWHDPNESTPLKLEMLRFSQVANKQTFDEVFVEYGKSLKPDLVVGQWNHLGDFNQINGDERCMLPAELWGKDENYLWYSTGGAAFYTDLKNKFLGDATLQCRYIRGTFDDKPYTLGKYEHCRNRNAIAELAANGGAPMGFYARFTDPVARGVFNEYFGFLRRYDEIYRANISHAEVLLMFPRTAIHQGNVDVMEKFKSLGRILLDDHILFDVRPDDLPTEGLAEKYKYIVTIDRPDGLTTEQKGTLTRIEAPYTVRASASKPATGNAIDIHLVNYNREEPEDPKTSGTGTIDEKPIAVGGINVNLVLPAGAKVKSVELITPESPEPVELSHRTEESGQLSFTVPEFLVYGVVRVGLE